MSYKCYILIEMRFLKELILIKQRNKKSAIFVTIGIFLNKGFKFQPNLCNRCQDLLMMSMNLSDIAISNIKSADYRCIISRICKREAINLIQYIDLREKSGKF